MHCTNLILLLLLFFSPLAQSRRHDNIEVRETCNGCNGVSFDNQPRRPHSLSKEPCGKVLLLLLLLLLLTWCCVPRVRLALSITCVRHRPNSVRIRLSCSTSDRCDNSPSSASAIRHEHIASITSNVRKLYAGLQHTDIHRTK